MRIGDLLTRTREADWQQEWRRRQEEQIGGRTEADFYPVSEAYLRENDVPGPEVAASIAFAGTFQATAGLTWKIRPLEHSAREVARVDYDSPSAVLNEACRVMQRLVDMAISDVPTEILVYLESPVSVDLVPTRRAMLQRLDDDLEWSDLHRMHRTHRLWLREYLGTLGEPGYELLREALGRLSDLPLFDEEDAVSPLALDVFPSLIGRADELRAHARRIREEHDSTDG